MGKITVAIYTTLDGVFESPSWTAPYWDEALAKYQDEAQKAADSLLLGRFTFEQFAKDWPDSRDEGAPYMNNIEKFVPTTRLDQTYWRANFIRHDAMNEIRRLTIKRSMLVYGSGKLVQGLFNNGLVDEYREMVFPIILGEGRKLFDSPGKQFAFSKVESRVTPKGVLLNTYTR